MFYRFGQLLSSLMPRDLNDENDIVLYTSDDIASDSSELNNVKLKQKKSIRLRNLLLDVLMSHFTTEKNEFDAKYVKMDKLSV